MKISDKINMNFSGLKENGAINIVALGDSVTHGAFAANEIDYESVYHNVLKKKINKQRNYVPVNVINSGIGGDTAQGALLRLDRDVFKYMPDLVIVCFGLNDINNPLKDYIFAMRDIFSRCKKNIEETIFLTPNMLNTYTAANTACENIQYSKLTAGRLRFWVEQSV